MATAKSNHRAAVYLALASVPAGRVVTYGQLAQMAGLPRAARLVGTLLRDLPEGSELPWHRVVNAQGKISLPSDSVSYREQLQCLHKEGVILINEKISLRLYGYHNELHT